MLLLASLDQVDCATNNLVLKMHNNLLTQLDAETEEEGGPDMAAHLKMLRERLSKERDAVRLAKIEEEKEIEAALNEKTPEEEDDSIINPVGPEPKPDPKVKPVVQGSIVKPEVKAPELETLKKEEP